MLTRILSAIIAIPILLFVVYQGGLLLNISVSVIALLGLKEFYKAFESKDMYGSKIGYLSILLIFILTLKETNSMYLLAWIFISVFLSIFRGLFGKNIAVGDSMLTAFGVVYVVFSFFHIVFISNLVAFSYYIWLIFITAWATDTFAYFTGYFLGKTKLCPRISPKKTIEGSIGGILGSIGISALYMIIVNPDMIIHGMIIGFLGSIVGQIGDLTASLFKRYVGIKDYGTLMPGHGGILDRFDSILFTAPLVYYYVIFVLS